MESQDRAFCGRTLSLTVVRLAFCLRRGPGPVRRLGRGGPGRLASARATVPVGRPGGPGHMRRVGFGRTALQGLLVFRLRLGEVAATDHGKRAAVVPSPRACGRALSLPRQLSGRGHVRWLGSVLAALQGLLVHRFRPVLTALKIGIAAFRGGSDARRR